MTFFVLVTIFIVLVGDDWHLVYYDAIRSVGYVSTVYFVSLIILGNFVILNLFLAILLGYFDCSNLKDEKEKNEALK